MAASFKVYFQSNGFIMNAKYTESVLDSIKLSISFSLITLIMQLFALFTERIHGKKTGFNVAADLLTHYGEAAPDILALFFVSIILLSSTIITEPSHIFIRIRKYIAIPALNFSQHMFAMSIGSVLATLIYYLLRDEYRHQITITSIKTFIVGELFLIFLNLIGIFLNSFMEINYNKIVLKQKYAVIFIAILFFFLTYYDLVFYFPVNGKNIH